MFNNLKFPYFNMQSLNLDWLLDKVATFPEIIPAPALTEETNQAVFDAIDNKYEYIPVGISFLLCGTPNDLYTKRCGMLVFKLDNDYCYAMLLTLSTSLMGKKCAKSGDTWVMYS